MERIIKNNVSKALTRYVKHRYSMRLRHPISAITPSFTHQKSALRSFLSHRKDWVILSNNFGCVVLYFIASSLVVFDFMCQPECWSGPNIAIRFYNSTR